MIRRRLCVFAVLAVLCILPLGASMADDAGVLSENELNTWVKQVLWDSAEETPENAPVGEESLTEDGYAFLYSFATLYYNKPELDHQSVLKSVVVTDESYASPRGIALGSDARLLLNSYGWQNPLLLGDGSFAAFYRLDRLPDAAYWCWARHEGERLSAVQCAVHARIDENVYTDAGMLYTVEDGKVTGIRAYGLDERISAADVKKNLRAVMGVEASGSGDELDGEHAYERPAIAGWKIKSEQGVFAREDLQFGGIDYLTLTEQEAKRVFGDALDESRVRDDTGAWLATTLRDGLTLSYTVSADEKASHLESLSLSKNLTPGPRGIGIGASLSDALAAFYSDGLGRVRDGAALLYGDGVIAPFGLMERADAQTIELRYALVVDGRQVTLNMTFLNDRLAELMIYSW